MNNNTTNNTSNNTMSSSSRPAYATLSMATTTPGPSIGLPHDCSLSDPDLRLLVLDYCVHAGYLDTAKALLATPRSDDHVPEDPAGCDDTPMAGQDQPQLEDHRELLHDMKQRKHVVSLIEQGKIADALHLLSVLCPKIVHLPAKVQPESNTLLHTRPLKRSKTASPADDIDMPEWQPTKAAFDRAKQPTCPDACPNTLRSDANRIIGLDLRIQAFIELMRTSNQRGSFLSPSDSDYASDQDNKALVLGLPLYNLAWASILTLGQTLFALTAALDIPPNIASAYQAELNHASELFLYANPDDAPESSHVRELLQFDRRRELAQRVNSAMLGKPRPPRHSESRSDLGTRHRTQR